MIFLIRLVVDWCIGKECCFWTAVCWKNAETPSSRLEAVMLPGLGFHSWKIVYAIASAQYSWGSKRETIVVKGSKWKHKRKILKCYPPVFSDDEHLTFETTGSPCFPSEFYLRRSVPAAFVFSFEVWDNFLLQLERHQPYETHNIRPRPTISSPDLRYLAQTYNIIQAPTYNIRPPN